jgi:predicted XRE-type DNA-binding protein
MQFQDDLIVNKAYLAITQPKIKDSPYIISQEEHTAELESFKEGVKHQKFYFVINRCTKSIENIIGLNQWLGYDEDTFDLKTYFKSINPNQLIYLITLAEQAFKITELPNFTLRFGHQQYIVDLEMKHAAGHYVMCKRVLTPWQWQNNGEEQILTHYLLDFTVHNFHIDQISDELKPRVYDKFGNKLTDLEGLLRLAASSNIENESNLFTSQEYRILRKFANNKNITSEEIATAFKIKKSTVHTFNKSIIEKGRLFFKDNKIENAKDLALRLRNNYLI